MIPYIILLLDVDLKSERTRAMTRYKRENEILEITIR